jgi:hypothetical protein
VRSRVRVLECPKCGAPLPRRALLVRLVCEYCRSEVVVDRWAVKAADYRRTLEAYNAGTGEVSIRVAGVPWRVTERVAAGHGTDVFRALRATRLVERALAKLLRAAGDEGLIRSEQAVLSELATSDKKGADYFTTLLPQPIGFGIDEGNSHRGKLVALFRDPPGFAHTLGDVSRAYPHGVDPRHVVWLWGRALELLDWVHRNGWIHGALLPAHILVDVREHGVRLVGWSCAARPGTRLAAIAGESAALYPNELLSGAGVSTRSDLTMLARALLLCAGGADGKAPSSVPPELARLLEAEARGEGGADARELGEQLRLVARGCFGKPAFVKLEMP